MIEGKLSNERGKIGGIWVRGLCVKCNGMAGSLTDAQYGEFARAVSRWSRTRLLIRGTVPAVSVAPGPVARSVLYGMHALNPVLRELFPDLAAALARGDDEIALPDGLRLYAALYLKPLARVAGPIHAFRVLGDREAYMSFGEIFFSPLAWVLAPDEPDLTFQRHGWPDVSDWSTKPSALRDADLRSLTRTFPPVGHPLHESDDWAHLFSNEITPIVEGIAAPS